MARVLIVGCGCRGGPLARALIADGLAVRATTRDPGRMPAIAATGAEVQLADPDRIGTLMSALAGVTVVCWLMGTAGGDPQHVRALHDERLRMFFERLVDTPVRGVVYEGAGTLDPGYYARGRAIAEAAAATWALPVEVLATHPAEHAAWLADARAAVAHLLTPSAR